MPLDPPPPPSRAELTLRALSQLAQYDYSRLSRAERGEHLVHPSYVAAIDKALHAGGLLVTPRVWVAR